MILAVGDEFFENIQGTTDSELMFHLALTFGMEKDVPGAIACTTGLLNPLPKIMVLPNLYG